MAITCALGLKRLDASKHHDNLSNSNRKKLESILTILTEFYINTEDCLKLTKWPVFRVTRPYSNLPVKPRNFSCFLEKKVILCILKGILPFNMHRIIFLFFSEKKIIKKNMCAYPT